MSQDQQFLSPDQQDKLFQKLKDAGLLSQDHGAPAPAMDTTSDPAVQQGVGNVDFSTLQSLIKHAVNPSSVPMQDGDKMHPMDAIKQIHQDINGPSSDPAQGPTAPSGVSQATGPQLQADNKGLLYANAENNSPLGKLLGLHQKVYAQGNNYYGAAVNAGITKFLPTKGLPQSPDGTPFVDAATFQHALTTHRVVNGQGSDVYSKADLIAQGVSEDKANELMAAAVASGKSGVPSKELSNYQGSERIKSGQQLADARSTMAQMAVLAKKLQVGGFNAAQPLVESSFKNVGLAVRAQQAMDQIMAAGGLANKSQRAELAATLGALTGQNAGVLTDERMNQYLPKSAKAEFGNVWSYWTNANQPIDFTGFMPQLQDLLTREKQANQGMIQAGQALGINIMAQTQPKTANALQANLNANPLVASQASTMKVRRLSDGQIGSINASDYDPSKYGKL